MENDDGPVGRVLSRREFLAVMAAAGIGSLAACTGLDTRSTPTSPSSASTQAANIPDTGSLPTCIVRPEMTEGPYFVDEQLNRSDIRQEPSDGSLKEGIPLVLTFNVSLISNDTCAPLPGAIVDVWHCDAQGLYSGVADRMVGFDTSGMQFLRGFQVTDQNGAAQFTTIYPGWYPGRAVHIHFKIRTDTTPQGSYEFTSQLFFDDAITDQVHAQEPYASKGQRDRLNSQDGIYRNGGDQLTLVPTSADDGYTSTFNIALDL